MLKNKKIELQAKTIRRLHEDNIRLNKENNELKNRLKEQSILIETAETYRTEHQKALSALNDAKERYNEAVRIAVAEKRRCRKEFEECLKRI